MPSTWRDRWWRRRWGRWHRPGRREQLVQPRQGVPARPPVPTVEGEPLVDLKPADDTCRLLAVDPVRLAVAEGDRHVIPEVGQGLLEELNGLALRLADLERRLVLRRTLQSSVTGETG